MIRAISKIRNRYYLPHITAVLTVLSVAAVTAAGGVIGREVGVKAGTKKNLALEQLDEIDAVHMQRVKFAADHGVADPAALVAAVKHSPMANLLISVAIEESRGDPVAVGSAGELGAWQVKASDWGSVPPDIHGQAGQAERIIRGLLIDSKGNHKKALARYNGGTTPPGESYRYAERILKRARHLQVAVNYLPQNFNKFRSALLDIPGNPRILLSFFQTGTASNGATVLS